MKRTDNEEEKTRGVVLYNIIIHMIHGANTLKSLPVPYGSHLVPTSTHVR